jgi:uncharacterized membrane protein
MTGRGVAHAPLAVRKIGVRDLLTVLIKGTDDFIANPTQLLFLGVIYPVVGVFAARAASGRDLLPLLYPLVAGLSLMGPVAAIGIYELSRRREQGLPVSWFHVFDVLRSPSLPSILALGFMLLGLFGAWIATAKGIYDMTLGSSFTFGGVAQTPESFFEALFTTSAGWTLIIVGNGVGFLFALGVLTLTVVSFPLLLEHEVGVEAAVQTSIRAVAVNPVPMALWGVIVAVLLVVGCLPFFVGLAVVMPILGHATWHLYRRVVVS